LEDFAYGRGSLPPEKLQALAKDLFPKAEYDLALNLMRPANKAEPKPMGVAPPPFKPEPKVWPKWTPGPQPVKPEKPQPKPKRAGWLHDWL
jgi:hypothetical protein